MPRLIEYAFPLKQVSLDSVHDKNVRHGRISTLHIWPALRLFYVAMTRARYKVHLLWSGWYNHKGNRYSNGRSKFVDEVMTQVGGVA